MTNKFKNETNQLLHSLRSEAEIHRVPFDGGQVTWRRFGSGDPLVLLHGGHGRWTHWVLNIRELSNHFTLWIPDLPGYGDSDKPVEETLESLVDATFQTLSSLIPSELTLQIIAFSFGSLVAVPLAVRRGSVSRIALLGPAGHGSIRRPSGELHQWRDLPQGSQAWYSTMRHNLMTHMIHHDENGDALALEVHSDACVRTRFHSKHLSRAGRLPELLSKYQGPLLLMWGEHDVTADPERAAYLLAKDRFECEVVHVANVGHWVQYEAAPQVNERVLAWLQKTKQSD